MSCESTKEFLQKQKEERVKALEDVKDLAKDSPENLKNTAKAYLDGARERFKARREQDFNVCMLEQLDEIRRDLASEGSVPAYLLRALLGEASSLRGTALGAAASLTNREAALAALIGFVSNKKAAALMLALFHAKRCVEANEAWDRFVEAECERNDLAGGDPVPEPEPVFV